MYIFKFYNRIVFFYYVKISREVLIIFCCVLKWVLKIFKNECLKFYDLCIIIMVLFYEIIIRVIVML